MKIIIFLLLLLMPNILICQNNNDRCQADSISNRDSIKYFPEMFHQIDINKPHFDLDLIDDFEHLSMKMDSINIKVPRKVVYKDVSGNLKLSIPIRFTYIVSNLQRANNETLSGYVVCVRSLSDSLEYSGEITESLEGLYIGALLIKDRKEQRKFYKKVRQGKISPDQSRGSGGTADILQFVRIPIVPGRYEVYMKYFGLESNHEIIEIEFE